jgi:hypothetical protein
MRKLRYESKNRQQLQSKEIKSIRKIEGCTLREHYTNTSLREHHTNTSLREHHTNTSLREHLLISAPHDYRNKWPQRLERLQEIRISKEHLNCSARGRRDFGRPRKK